MSRYQAQSLSATSVLFLLCLAVDMRMSVKDAQSYVTLNAPIQQIAREAIRHSAEKKEVVHVHVRVHRAEISSAAPALIK